MGGCQNYSPFLGNLNIRCRIIIGIQKRDHHFDNHPCVDCLDLKYFVTSLCRKTCARLKTGKRRDDLPEKLLASNINPNPYSFHVLFHYPYIIPI